MAEYDVQGLLKAVSSAGREGGSERVRTIAASVIEALYGIMDKHDVTPAEFWATVRWLARVGVSGHIGLVTASLGFDRLLDVLEDRRAAARGQKGTTPRAIEGPLYIADAPLSKEKARLDNGSEQGTTLLFSGRVVDVENHPIPGAVVDVWHANATGGYSHFDPSQAEYNLRRRIETDAVGRYSFRTLLPAGYRVPPDTPTSEMLDLLGRHGWRPAHIHFMVSAPGFEQLTTQVNLPDDPYLNDDMAFATRDELIVEVVRHDDPAEIHAHGFNAPFVTSSFDFCLAQAT